MKILLAILLAAVVPSLAFAYPDFIGFGYNSCLTCHVNGLGSGPLNDYGRALWSAEIASRAFYPKGMTDEQIAAKSGFLGGTELPYWIRPHIKYRGLQLKRNYAGPNEVSKTYQMQTDFGLTLSDEVGKYVAVITYGNLQYSGEDKQRILAREYYLRTEVVPSWWVYVGLLEKAFGIRNIDHESFQRKPQGFRPTLDDVNGLAQSHGLIVQKIDEKWDVAVNAFVGNPYDSKEFQQKGFSSMGEFEVGDKKRLGASVMTAKSDMNKKDVQAIHWRQAISPGSSMLFEYGLIQNQNTGSERTSGSYNLLQTLMKVTRGYNLKATIERYNAEFKPSEPDTWKWGFGMLAWPAPRLELRTEFINIRSFSNQPVNDDSWVFQGQVHVSL